ncbi:MAG: Response regulator containing a CheY-like receiver domain and an DNA-binding domain [Frankiales bacterium]|nr:Response regulator containing a CheY-like receiver domain and an DNA-binding domain [Frankiales bacterium]
MRDEVTERARQLVDADPAPSLVIEVPTRRIIAASPSAATILDPSGGAVVGHNLEDYTADCPSGVLTLFAQGRLTGFEAQRLIARDDGHALPISLWVRHFAQEPPSRYALVLLAEDEPPPMPRASYLTRPETMLVVGTLDQDLRLEQVSSDAETVFGTASDRIIGMPLTSLIAQEDRGALAAAAAEASSSHGGVALHLRAHSSEGRNPLASISAGEALLLPLAGAGFAFVLVLGAIDGASGTRPADLASVLRTLAADVAISGLARDLALGLTEDELPGLSRLTTRELEIITRLLGGERAPALAERLFLSQSTVRSHLGSAFGKLGISSQQELLDRVREARHPSDYQPLP